MKTFKVDKKNLKYYLIWEKIMKIFRMVPFLYNFQGTKIWLQNVLSVEEKSLKKGLEKLSDQIEGY